MKNNTEHLKGFQLLSSACQLYGDKYVLPEKALWYSLHGLALMPNKVKIGAIDIDTRVHIMYPLKTNAGKNNLKKTSKKVIKAMGLRVEEPTSLHPEQLVGKVIRRKEKVLDEITGKYQTEEMFIPNRGYFDCDLLQIDEAVDLLTSEEPLVEESRKYLCLATDQFGNNIISKRSVDNKPNERVEYPPECTAMLFFQPVHVPAKIITRGLMRRFLTPYIELGEENRAHEFAKRLEDDTNTESCIAAFASHLRELRKKHCFSFTPDSIEQIKVSQLELIRLGIEHSPKGKTYTCLIGYTLQDFLIRLSVILAASQGVEQVQKEHVHLAFLDLWDFYNAQLNFINAKVYGDFDYGEAWNGAPGKFQKCLEWLWLNKGRSEAESGVSIRQFLGVIQNEFNIKEDMANKKLAHFKFREWIQTKQDGSYDSKVWLAFTPAVYDEQGSKGSNSIQDKSLLERTREQYQELIDKLKNNTLTVQPLRPSTELTT